MARLCSDENFLYPVVLELRRLGHAVQTCQEAGKSGRAGADAEVLAFASEPSRAVLTIDRRHFVRLHEERPDHCGIVVCSLDPDTSVLAARIAAIAAAMPGLDQKLVRVDRPVR
ncbi:MAG: DUF5615 family PIN-like protein [Chloroflexi bacterium]|nr:DUF5615 family PIN-like protein [Chloroflexota bacterium]